MGCAPQQKLDSMVSKIGLSSDLNFIGLQLLVSFSSQSSCVLLCDSGMSVELETALRVGRKNLSVKISSPDFQQWREDLFDSMIRDDLDGVISVLGVIKRNGKKPSDSDLCDPKYKTTVLHAALHSCSKRVAEYLIDHHDYKELLVAECTGIMSPRDNLYAISRDLHVVCCTDCEGSVAKGDVGTIVDVISGTTKDRSSQTIEVNWECGARTTHTCADENLRILDNSRLGVTHQLMCDGCYREEFDGFRWKCAACCNYELCNGCYSTDKHNLSHEFYRIDMPGCERVSVSARDVVKDGKITLSKPHHATSEGFPAHLGLLGFNRADILPGNSASQQGPNKRQLEVVRNTRASVFWPSTHRTSYTGNDNLYVNTSFRTSAWCYVDHLPKLSEYGHHNRGCEIYDVEDDDEYQSLPTLRESGLLRAPSTKQGGTENNGTYLCKITVQDLTLTNDDTCFNVTCLTILAATGDTKLAKHVLNGISDKETFLSYNSPSTYHCIHIAAANGHASFVDLLISCGVDVNCRGRHLYTPVMYALRGQHLETVEVLIDRQADLTAASKRGKTALDVAVRNGSLELVQLLIDGDHVREINQVVNTRHKFTMLMVASQTGRFDIVEYLLAMKADVGRRSATRSTALHEAAWNGHADVVELLLTNGKADVKWIDDNGDTALLLAAHQKHLNVIRVLIKHGAHMDHSNMEGKSIWNYVLNGDDQLVIETIQLYRESNNMTNAGCKFSTNANPLIVATRDRKIDKLQLLFKHGVYVHSADFEGNTFFHVAASEGYMEPLELFEKQLRMGSANNYGQTVLHLAAINKHVEIVKFLIRKSERENKSRYTKRLLLTAAAFGELDVTNSVSEAIKQIGKSLPLEECDFQGNTALHLAARRGDISMIRVLVELQFNPQVWNKVGLVPFHEAILSGKDINIVELLTLFSRCNTKFDVNVTSKRTVGVGNNTTDDGSDCDTALHMCSRRGDWHNAEQLIQAGANLEMKNSHGNTALHVLVQGCTRDPDMSSNYAQTIDAFKQLAAKWWFEYKLKPSDESTEARAFQRIAVMNFKRSTSPDSQTTELVRTVARKWLRKCGQKQETAEDQTRNALLHLLWEIRNKDGDSVISLAVKSGAVVVIDSLLDTPNVFRFCKNATHYAYDVTYLTPDTNELDSFSPSATPSRHKSTDDDGRPVCSGDQSDKGRNDGPTETQPTRVAQKSKSCLELVMNLVDDDNGGSDENLMTAARMLDTNPMRILVDNYRRGFQNLFRLLTLVHVVHMVCFTYFTLPDVDQVNHMNKSILSMVKSTEGCTTISNQLMDPWTIFLIWPTSIVVGLTMLWFLSLAKTPKPRHCPKMSRHIFSVHKLALKFTANHLPQLSMMAFSLLTGVWYFLHWCGSDVELYLQVSALIFLFGWSMTLFFAKSAEDLIFSALFERIAFRDISRFAFIYTIVLLGFGLAFHTLFQLSPGLGYSSPVDTLIAVFNLMMGVSNPLEEDFEANYGGNKYFVYSVYMFYALVGSIVLINLLIAMMTNSYESLKQNASIVWRVSSLRLALRLVRIRNSLPFISKRPWSTSPYRIKFDPIRKRWMLVVPMYSHDDDSSDRHEKLDAIFSSIRRLEIQLNERRSLDKNNSGEKNSSDPYTDESRAK